MNNIGYVEQAPRVVSFADTGNKVVKFSIAVREFSNKEESTLWIDVEAWNGLGESIMKTVKKGREVMLTGRLAISIFTKEVNGVKTEVHKPVLKLSSFHLCGPKPAEDSSSGETAPREMDRVSA